MRENWSSYVSKGLKFAVLLIVTASVVLVMVNAASYQLGAKYIRPPASEYDRRESHAITPETGHALGRALEEELRSNQGKSGFRILETGTESLKYRMSLIQAAEKSIDLQYYTMHDDTSANLLLEALLEAAGRGVRVRFLIDHISIKEVGPTLGVLDGVKNIEVRVFNPPYTRDQGYIARLLSYTRDIGKVFKRMHNKALIADNQFAIMGGRNLGDEYFEAHKDHQFKDTDILAAGPMAARISHSFDNYWNGEDAFPIEYIRRPVYSKKKIDKLRKELREQWQKQLQTEDGKKTLQSDIIRELQNKHLALVWAKGELWADESEKINQAADDAESKPLDRMQELVTKAKQEFIIVSPYFVPKEEGVEWLASLVQRGIKVRVLTNSLASTDVVAVHTGYRKYREELLKKGIELYEFKAIDHKHPRQRLFGGTAPAHAVLHTKMYVLDRETLLIGSFNLDPRSTSLNTEIAMVIHHPQLGGEAAQLFEDAIGPKTSYRLKLNEQGKLVWLTEEKKAPATYAREPEAGLRNLQAAIFGLLPVEDQL